MSLYWSNYINQTCCWNNVKLLRFILKKFVLLLHCFKQRF